MRLGIFGGAFNPPHVGHLACAQDAHAQLGLDTVVWVPTGRAPHREIEDDPGAEVRLQMCEHALAGDERFGLSRIEIDRPGPSYTVETLRAIRASRPEASLFLILGGDQAAALPAWHEPEEVLSLATVAAAARGERTRERVLEAISALAGSERVVFFDMPRIDVSSTLVRARVAAGQPIRYLVPDRVASFIGAHGLYGSSAPVGAGR
ncbi:MAG: nicotinate (nicotinamide) nucleotide adenylyltransferase [Thermoleophilaceae bacterium]|nr:nicotinate (nicotinamide) nucleotide adenylyltransferase [Thermoleophilaceae bacterium]